MFKILNSKFCSCPRYECSELDGVDCSGGGDSSGSDENGSDSSGSDENGSDSSGIDENGSDSNYSDSNGSIFNPEVL